MTDWLSNIVPINVVKNLETQYDVIANEMM